MAIAAIAAPLAAAHAAGGHFAVDDAFLLEAGQCQVEAWLERAGRARTVVHLGPACRVGVFELGANLDRTTLRDVAADTVAGAQVKWSRRLGERVDAGFVVATGWRTDPVRIAGTTAYVPLSVRLADAWLVNANAGRDWPAQAPATSRAGASLEWQVARAWTVIGEGFRQAGAGYARLGVRWQPSVALGVDVSRAATLGEAGNGSWALGVNVVFGAR